VILLFCTTMTRGYLDAPNPGVIRGWLGLSALSYGKRKGRH